MTATTSSRPDVWLRREDCSIEDFRVSVEAATTDLGDYPHARAVEQGVVLYGPELSVAAADPAQRRAVQSEIVACLLDGPGIAVFQGALADDVIDRSTAVFEALLAAQKAAGVTGGDHFGKPGANDRLWSALDKLAVADPEVFFDYYANDVLALVAQAWLGPNYQFNSSLNVVNPGGAAQVAHRDYHLGFMPLETAARYPEHVHRLSPVLTLQGAVAHCDMPVETGPTMYLPHSQKYVPGYLAAGLPEFVEYFAEHHVQLPLRKGDVVFFNPALFHAAGTNRSTDVRRMANLLQVSSAFGRSLESVARARMLRALYPVLRDRRDRSAAAANVIAAAAEGYPFPTNLDLDQPVGSLNPETQAELVDRALAAGWSAEQFENELAGHEVRHQA